MPTVPSSNKCNHLGCTNAKAKLGGYCLEHGGREYSAPRATDSVYQTPAWRSIRQRQLSLQPLCQACLASGRIEAAQHVDHVFPWKHIGKQAFLHNVFQSLCAEHHSFKTGKEKHGVYLSFKTDGVVEYSKTDYPLVVGYA